MASFGTASLRAVFLDARRGEIYGAVYDATLTPVEPEVVIQLPAWLERLPEGELELIAADFGPFNEALAGTRFTRRRVAPRALAGAIARIAAERLASGLAQDPAAIDANYVRRSDAELYWRE
jgi:tRNA threonylcarbamoyladenosine biosynthesis protein TsaB